MKCFSLDDELFPLFGCGVFTEKVVYLVDGGDGFFVSDGVTPFGLPVYHNPWEGEVVGVCTSCHTGTLNQNR